MRGITTLAVLVRVNLLLVEKVLLYIHAVK
jgi:hypothetical protein